MRVRPRLVSAPRPPAAAAVAALAACLATAVGLALPGPAAAAASWASIAVDPASGAVGYSRHQPSARSAKVVARQDCAEKGCRTTVWVSNGYGAVVQKENGVYIAGIGRTLEIAFRKARERAGERAARRVAWVSGYP